MTYDEMSDALRTAFEDLERQRREAEGRHDDDRVAELTDAIGSLVQASAAVEERHAVVGDRRVGSTDPDDDPASAARPAGPTVDPEPTHEHGKAPRTHRSAPIIGALPDRADAGVPADELPPGYRAGTAS